MNEDTIYFWCKNSDVPVKCDVNIDLVFLYGYDRDYPSLNEVNVTRVNLIDTNSDKRYLTDLYNNECVSDTIKKYLQIYYDSPNTLYNTYILREINGYMNKFKNFTISTNFSPIYIYPYNAKESETIVY